MRLACYMMVTGREGAVAPARERLAADAEKTMRQAAGHRGGAQGARSGEGARRAVRMQAMRRPMRAAAR